MPASEGWQPVRAAALSAFRLHPYLGDDVLNRQSRAQESHTLAVHNLEQIPAGAIDADDVLEINQNLAAGITREYRLPVVLEFGHESARQPPCNLQDHTIAGLRHLHLHHL